MMLLRTGMICTYTSAAEVVFVLTRPGSPELVTATCTGHIKQSQSAHEDMAVRLV